MFTAFDLIRLLATVVGAYVLGRFGWHRFGIIGGVLGVPIGLILGRLLGQLPLVIAIKFVSRDFDRFTDAELLAKLHHADCLIPNLYLLKLKQRGYDIRQELPYIQSLLASTEIHRRTAGWAALNSVFPDLVVRIKEYAPTATTVECQEKSKPLLDAMEQREGN